MWFDEARLGMFVHWDHASQQGLEVSWPLVGGVFALPKSQRVTAAQYHSSAATFDPVEWDPVGLARMARQAGMRYAVLTTKHHSGYTMWPSKYGDHSAPFDIVGSFVSAVRAEGLRVGLYFSLSDWHHPDYPAWTEAFLPYQFGQSPPRPPAEAWARFVSDFHGQIDELLTNYGTVDLLWFDGGWERTPSEWRASDLEDRIRALQPDILINDRLPGGHPDFTTPEQFVPPKPLPGRWETCLTMNDSWGWVPDDAHYKSGRRLVHTLCEVAGKGGNLLLNLSPTGTGAIPPAQVSRLEHLARWMGRHGSAIAGTAPGLEPWQWYGPSTRNGDTVYLHLLSRPYDSVTVRGIPVRRVAAVRVVGSDVLLKHSIRTGIIEALAPDPDGELTIYVPPDAADDDATVIAIDFASAPLSPARTP
jgi:alpha-L-fucosidase